MTNLIRFDGFDDAEIRVTPDGRYSVYDVIRFCGCKGQWEVWKRLAVAFPELLTKCEEYKFAGRGGAARPTPVASRESILQIIGLLPGAVGRSYRESAAKVFIAFLDASPELAESVIERAKPEDLQKIEKRLRSKKIRVRFASTLFDHGVEEEWQFAACTNAIYQPVLGADAKTLKEQRGLAKKDSLRDNLASIELTAVMLAEELAEQKIKQENIQGFKGCRDASAEAGRRVRRVFD